MSNIERFEELAINWENEAHHLYEQGHDEAAESIEGCASELHRAIDMDASGGDGS